MGRRSWLAIGGAAALTVALLVGVNLASRGQEPVGGPPPPFGVWPNGPATRSQITNALIAWQKAGDTVIAMLNYPEGPLRDPASYGNFEGDWSAFAEHAKTAHDNLTAAKVPPVSR